MDTVAFLISTAASKNGTEYTLILCMLAHIATAQLKEFCSAHGNMHHSTC